MFAVALTALVIAVPPDPPEKVAPIPDRWLLKLVPKELPKLPEAFAKMPWSQYFNPRAGDGWQEWFAFAPEAGEVCITRQNFRISSAQQALKVRTVPLAVHGVLVEFDRKLYTVAVTEWKSAAGKVTPLLSLGAAIEVRPNVWYQAFSDALDKGKVKVTELLVEFSADPRKKDEGKATLRKQMRMLDEFTGETTDVEGTFAKKDYGSSKGVEITYMVKPSGREPYRDRLWLKHATSEGPALFNLTSTVRLVAESNPIPKLPPESVPSFVQPPKKP